VRILDGGLAAWRQAGGAVESGSVTPAPGDVTVAHDDLYAGALPTLTADDVAGYGGVLLDARAPERFRGEVEPVDPVAGHIPGARNAPSTAALAADGTFLPTADLIRLFESHGATIAPGVGVYCGSGVTAAVAIAALRAADVEAELFPGSWSQWSSDATRPVAIGREG
jgi:thiosulfate/3-mercaptopyruvate sulfurtransferase